MTKEDPIYKEIKSYDKRILDFDRDNPALDFRPAHYPPKENGLYLTIRCGLSGIYQTLNEWKDGHWMNQVLDGSETIAYSREKIVLKNL